MSDRLVAADAWRRAAVAAETAQLAFERLEVLERDGAAWLAIATAWRHATWAKNAAMSALEDAASDRGPTHADLRGEVDHVADRDKWVDELASEIEWEPLRNFVLRLKKPESDLRGDVDHGD